MDLKALFMVVTSVLVALALPAAGEPQFTYNSPTADETLSVSNPVFNVSIVNATADTGWGNVTTVNIWLKNLTYVFDSYLVNGTSWSGNGNNWRVNFSNNSMEFLNGTGTVLSSTPFTGDSVKLQGLNASNQSSVYMLFYMDANFTALTPGDYSLFFGAAASTGEVNDTQSTGTYVNFTLGGATVSDLETYLNDSVLSGATANFRNAANTADATGDILTASRYSLAITITADSTVLTLGNWTSPTWSNIGSVSTTASASVGSSNDPSDIQSTVRAWLDNGSFIGSVDWARAMFVGTLDRGYTLTGTAASPTWTRINRFCDSMSSIMSGATDETLPCVWRPGDGYTYLIGSSFTGYAVGDDRGGSSSFGGGGSGYIVTQPDSSAPVLPGTTDTPATGYQPSRGWWYENAGLVVIGALLVVLVVSLLAMSNREKPYRKGGTRRRRR